MARRPRYVFSDGSFHVTARGAGRIAIYRDADDCRLSSACSSSSAARTAGACTRSA
jgi:hypothetical protein